MPARPSGRSAQAPGHRHPASVLFARAGLPRRRQLPRLHGRDRRRARAGGELHPHADAGHEGEDRRPTAPRRRAGWWSNCWSPTSRPKDVAHDPDSQFWATGPTGMNVDAEPLSRARAQPAPDRSHPAMAVNLDACIQCNLCVRACREVQVNDVIGMAGRGHDEKIVFDFDDPMGASTCVACGECVQACPTGALMPATLVDDDNVRTEYPRPRGRQRVPLLRRRLPAHLPDQGRQARSTSTAATARRTRTGCASRAASASTTCTNPHRLTKPLMRKDGVPKAADDLVDPANPWTHFREATWEEALDARRQGPEENPRPRRPAGRSPASARPRARTRRPICSRSWCAPASAPTTSITARGCATPRRWRRCWKASARRR